VEGIYNTDYYESTKDSVVLTNTSKSWWVQAEALNALLLMMREFPDDERRYDDRFRKQWAYIKENLNPSCVLYPYPADDP
jgi:mannose/cellobiose epimerase-like protein (N-acyl-D-glucosamine 2-epimerase family)